MDNDYLLCLITSNLRNDMFSYFLRNENLSRPLPKPSEVRCNKIVAIRENMIIGKFASLLNSEMSDLIEIIRKSFD